LKRIVQLTESITNSFSNFPIRGYPVETVMPTRKKEIWKK